MPPIRLAAASAHFGRDLDACLLRIASIVEHAREAGARLLVLPHAALGGYLADLRNLDPDSLPPALDADSEVFTRLRRLAGDGDVVVCVGYTEQVGDDIYNSAVCLSGDGALGRHRKVHLPPGEALVYSAGDAFEPFDTPVGRLGMLIDYDKTFPEAARTLAAGGGRILAFLSAWPASVTRRASSVVHDRQTRLFDLYDAARAAENQVVVVSANQTGTMGGLRFIGHTKIVGPGGESLARTGVKAELVVAEIDVDAEIARARRVQYHLRERRPDTYALDGQRRCDHGVAAPPEAHIPGTLEGQKRHDHGVALPPEAHISGTLEGQRPRDHAPPPKAARSLFRAPPEADSDMAAPPEAQVPEALDGSPPVPARPTPPEPARPYEWSASP